MIYVYSRIEGGVYKPAGFVMVEADEDSDDEDKALDAEYVGLTLSDNEFKLLLADGFLFGQKFPHLSLELPPEQANADVFDVRRLSHWRVLPDILRPNGYVGVEEWTDEDWLSEMETWPDKEKGDETDSAPTPPAAGV